jgi:GT2 family glycosyltransferase
VRVIRVSIIITTYARFQQVQDAVGSVTPHLCGGDEVLVVDNGFPPAQHAELAAIFHAQGVPFLREPQSGISPARNRAARQATGDVLAFLDDDAVACERWVEEIRRAFGESDCAAAGGPVRLAPELVRPNWLPPAYGYVFGELDFGGDAFDMRGRRLPMGANVAFRRATFVDAGMFPTSLGRTGNDFSGGEEIFVCRRILRQGGRIRYLPEMVVTHRVPQSRLTREHMYRSAYGIGCGDRRIERATRGRLAAALRGGLMAARLALEAPRARWRRRRGDERTWAAHEIRVAMLRGYLGLPLAVRRGPT